MLPQTFTADLLPSRQDATHIRPSADTRKDLYQHALSILRDAETTLGDHPSSSETEQAVAKIALAREYRALAEFGQ